MGFGQGLSGLNAASQQLDVIGNNVANSGTVGFKSSTVSFGDVYANTKVGLGVQVAAVNQRFTVGNISSTGGQFDMAIDGSKGLFRVEDPSGNILYTRNGQFFNDKDNYIVNAQGHRLTGYGVTGTDLVPLKVPVGNINPQATTTVGTETNLNANADAIPNGERLGKLILTSTTTDTTETFFYQRNTATGEFTWVNMDGTAAGAPAPADDVYTTAGGTQTIQFATGQATPDQDIEVLESGGNLGYINRVVAFDPEDPDSFTHSLPLSVYDSLGNAHQLTQYFVKRPATLTGESVWDVYYRLNGQPIDSPLDGATQLTFDGSGRMLGVPTVQLEVSGVGGGDSPADNLAITLNYNNSTQFGGPFAPNFTQNGYPTGEYAGLSIDADGSIIANYTNDESQLVGYIALADFNNLQGLKPVGGNAWAQTGASGQPVVGRPGSNGLATIKGQAVEESNVDMSQELVNMIIAQRTYQANAQTIKTQDQILQTLITMR